MRRSERNLYEQEAEIRPNHYVALALTVLSFFIIAMMLLNELDVFLVVKERMRFGAFAALIILEIPLFAASTETGLKNSSTKYLMIGCCGIATAILCTVLNFHATLSLFFPVLLASQYPSAKMIRIAMIGSILCAVITPVLGYLAGVWDTAFIQRLCEISGKVVFEAAEGEQMGKGTAVLQILLYLSLPHSLILLALYPLSAAISHSGEQRLKNEIQVLHMSESDVLTGVLNRTCFEHTLTLDLPSDTGTIAVLYADVNYLHRVNNEQGHSAGDRMLIFIANCLKDTFDDEAVYRIGGDEFVCILPDLTLSEIQKRMTQIDALVQNQGYSVSMGLEYAQLPCTLPALVNSADTKMRMEKEKYHITRDK